MAILIFFASCGTEESQPGSVSHDPMGSLVTAEWLSQHLNDTDLVILDCTVYMEPDSGGGMRAVSGRARYEEGHIPSAGFADLLTDLSNVDSPFGFAMPTPERFCAAMGKLGVGDDSRVVLYDTYNSVWAARVWWMLRWVGFDQAALLDGGLIAWASEERQLSTKPAGYPARKLTPMPRPALIADHNEVFKAMKDDAVHLIDAMPEPHFRGEMVMYGRPGHIPGAINMGLSGLVDNLDKIDPDAPVYVYCYTGHSAAQGAALLQMLGYDAYSLKFGMCSWSSDTAVNMGKCFDAASVQGYEVEQ